MLIEFAGEANAIHAFDKYAPIIGIGYEGTKAQVAAWQGGPVAQAAA